MEIKCDSNNHQKFKESIDYWDKKVGITMSKDLGETIEKYVDDPKYQFGIHRSNRIDCDDPKNSPTVQEVMQNGIVVMGDAASGSIRNDGSPSKSVDFCNNLMNAVRLIKGGRQGSNGAILVAIPKEFFDEDGYIIPDKVNVVYNHNKLGNSLINPNFIIGATSGGGRVGDHVTFVSRDEILNK